MRTEKRDAARPWWEQSTSPRYRLTDWLARRFPRWIDPPWFIADRAYIENEALDLPAQGLAEAGMTISTDGIWAVDFYTPATIEALIARIDDHGWGESSGGLRDIAGWLRRARDGQGGTKRLRLKLPGSPGDSFAFLELPLPPFATNATGEFATVSHSVLRLTMFFSLRADERLRINTALHEILETDIVRTKAGVSVLTPELVRKRNIAGIRADWRAQIRDWWAANLPGVLSTADDPGAMPVCELAVVDGFEPFPPRGPDGPPRSAMLQALEMSFSGWLFEEDGRRDQGWGSALFAADGCRAAGLRHQSILAVPRGRYEGTEARLNVRGGPERFAHDANDRFRRTMGQWGQLALLNHYAELIASARDKMHGMFGRRAGRSVLRRVGAITARCADARTVARESLELVDGPGLSIVEGYDFVRDRTRPREEATHVLTVIKRRLGEDARHLRIAVDELNEFLHQQANLMTAATNLRLQFWFGLLAVCSLLAAILGLEPIKHWLGWDGAVSASDQPATPVPPGSDRR